MLNFWNWQDPALDPLHPPAPVIAGTNSPNLLAILAWLKANIGGESWGMYVLKLISGGTSHSSHAFGAANDWHYFNEQQRLTAIDWLIANSEKLHVDMIIDEAHNRIWKSFRPELNGPGWIPYTIANGGTWLHYETTLAGWPDATPVYDRLALPAPQPDPRPQPVPQEDDMPRLITPTDDSAVLLLDGLTCTWIAKGEIVSSLQFCGIVPAGVTEVPRVALGAFELVGSAPQYPTGGSYKPGRTVISDFASHRG